MIAVVLAPRRRDTGRGRGAEVKWRALLLVMVSGSAWAAFEPPDTASCRDKFAQMACRRDDGRKGACLSQEINTPDFSVPGPPKFNKVATMVCVSTATEHSLMDLVYLFLGSAVVISLVVYNLLRRRTLSDYP